MKHLSLIATLSVLVGSVASAHPGHGSPAAQDGVWHYLSSPLHAGPALLAIVVVSLLVARWRKTTSKD